MNINLNKETNSLDVEDVPLVRTVDLDLCTLDKDNQKSPVVNVSLYTDHILQISSKNCSNVWVKLEGSIDNTNWTELDFIFGDCVYKIPEEYSYVPFIRCVRNDKDGEVCILYSGRTIYPEIKESDVDRLVENLKNWCGPIFCGQYVEKSCKAYETGNPDYFMLCEKGMREVIENTFNIRK